MNFEESSVFIGFGNMGSAIVNSISKKNIFKDILVIESDQSKTENNSSKKIRFSNSISEELSDHKYVWLCIKPQSFGYLAKEIKPYLRSNQIIISIMAGITINQINDRTNHEKIIRIMPNTPAQISKGISVWNSTNNLSEMEKNKIENALNSFGKSIYLDDESMINLSTALSGSGPGFLYRILESFIFAGEKIGLSKEVSKKLAIETFIGSGELINITENSPKNLREAVTSPGGTTEAGLNLLEKKDIDKLIYEMMKEAVQRGNDLAEESDK